MGTRTADYLEAVEHLPDGTMLVIPQSSWEEYERLLVDLVGWPGMRVTFDRGRLEIMSPSPEHEKYKELIVRLVYAAGDVLGIAIESSGSTTWKREAAQHGTEPDASFYVASAHRIIGKLVIDLTTDPPPDIAVEVDITNESLSKFPIYAGLGVPELWRYDGKAARFYTLTDGGYHEVEGSRFFGGLTSAMLTSAMDDGKKNGQTAAITGLRQRLLSAR